jgi:hypothetical protein
MLALRRVAARALPIEERANLKLATTYVINEGVAIATETCRGAGQTAIFANGPLEQCMRDALTASQ